MVNQFPVPEHPGQAQANQQFRDAYMSTLPDFPDPYVDPHNPQTQLLEDLVGSFSRYAGNQQTAFDSGAGRAGSSGGTNILESQVMRAWTQVLGRAPGSSPDSFMQALNSAFPAAANGVATLPARSAVSMYTDQSVPGYAPGGTPSATTVLGTYGGQLSARQAALYRQVSVIGADAQKVLASLTTFAPTADQQQVESLRSLIAWQIKGLLLEFGRVDEPRDARVNTLFQTLNDSVAAFRAAAVYDNQALIVTPDDESQIAGFELLQSYVKGLNAAWQFYITADPNDVEMLSLRIDRANVLLPIVGQANDDFLGALSSVGFSESEQRSVASRFSGLAELLPGFPPVLAAMTPSDLIDWIRTYQVDGLSIIGQAGLYGLNFVTDQADAIFWVIAPVLTFVRDTRQVNLTGPILLQILQNERVTWSLTNLITQLDTLADLAGPGAITL